MVIKQSSGLTTKNPLKRGGPIKKRGSRTIAWEKTRAEKAQSDVNEEGLIPCEDYKLGLPRCGIARQPEDMDLHHSKGRDGNLLTDKRWLVWLTRECHDAAHHPDTDNSRI